MLATVFIIVKHGDEEVLNALRIYICVGYGKSRAWNTGARVLSQFACTINHIFSSISIIKTQELDELVRNTTSLLSTFDVGTLQDQPPSVESRAYDEGRAKCVGASSVDNSAGLNRTDAASPEDDDAAVAPDAAANLPLATSSSSVDGNATNTSTSTAAAPEIVVDVVWENQRRFKAASSPWGRNNNGNNSSSSAGWVRETPSAKGGRPAFESARPELATLFAKHNGPPPSLQLGWSESESTAAAAAAAAAVSAAGSGDSTESSGRNSISSSDNSGAGRSASRVGGFLRRRHTVTAASEAGAANNDTRRPFDPLLENDDSTSLPRNGSWRWLSPWQV
jgi:hypothetical protein